MSSLLPTIKLSILNSIIKMLNSAIYFFFGIYFVEIGFSGAQIGILFAIGTITSIFTILPSGFSNDRFKSKHLIAAALVLSAMQFFGMATTHSFPLIAGLFLIGGLAGTLYNSSAESLFYKSTLKESVPKKIAIFQGLNYLMLAVGMIASGFMLETGLPFEKLFITLGIAYLVMTIVSQLVLPTSPTSKFEILHYKKDLLRPKVLLFILIVFLFTIHYGAEGTSYGLFLRKTLLLDKFQMGLYMGSAILFMALTALILAKKFRQWKAENILTTGLLLSGIGHILMTVKIMEISIAFRIIHEIGDAFMFFFMYYGITKLFDLKRIGGNAGIFSFTGIIGGAVGALIFGPLGEAKGYDMPLIVSGSILLIAFVLSVQFRQYFQHK